MVDAVYIHIPFCQNICSYCDFPKIFYDENIVDKYLIALKAEIKARYNKELINTIYIGGGTPALLNDSQLDKLYEIIELFNLASDFEFTIESNVDQMTEHKILKHLEHKVNRISVGIQTFNDNHLKYLKRVQPLVNRDLIRKINKLGMKNINIDMMYALKNQTLDDLNDDIDKVIQLNPTHISYYSLILEEHTKLYIDKEKAIDDNLDCQMYELINKRLTKAGYIHYEVSNYAKIGYECKHNLKYWHNLQYYGFGLGACSYINNIRMYNTSNITNYINNSFKKEEKSEDYYTRLENELLLGFRLVKGINIKGINDTYKLNILNNKVIKDLLNRNLLSMNEDNLSINNDYLYVSNLILIEVLGAFYD
ncbi:MAG: radical SAM family heme chaperone HemW [Bacilli bacterium]